MGKNYWMVVDPPERFEKLRELGFTVYAMGTKYRRRAQRMQPEDHILFYVSGIRKWTGTATVKSNYFTDNNHLWESENGAGDLPFRVKIQPDVVLDESQYIDALILAPRLEYVKRWAPEDWELAFWDSLHLLPQKDYRLIEGEMRRLAYNTRPPVYNPTRENGSSGRSSGRKRSGRRGRGIDDGPDDSDSQTANQSATDVSLTESSR